MADVTLNAALTGSLPGAPQAPPAQAQPITPAPPATVTSASPSTPATTDPGDDYVALKAQVAALYQQHKQAIDQEIALNTQGEKLTQQEQQPTKRGWVVDTALAIPGGVADGLINVYNKVEQWGAWIDNHIGAQTLHIGKDGVYFHPTVAYNQATPEWAKAQTVPGSLLHGVAQFAVGFALTRGVAAEAGALSVGGRIALNAARSSVSLATAFDAHEKNLANLLAEHSELAQPVAKYLAVQDDDSDATATLKNMVVGAGVGAAADAVFAGFMRGLNTIKAVRQQSTYEGAMLDSPKVPEQPPVPAGAAEIPSFPGLTPEQQAIEASARQQVLQNPEEALAAYKMLSGKDGNSDGGRIISTDVAREIFPEYSAGPEARSANAVAVHEPASYLTKLAYAERLAHPAEAGREPVAFFTGGGTGAGKTSAVRRIPAIKARQDSADVVYDGNLQSAPSASKKIDQALAAGRNAEVLYTFRNIKQAYFNGAIPRAERLDYGRTVPVNVHVDTHLGAARAYLALAAKYADNPRVKLRAIFNDFDGTTSLPPREMSKEEVAGILNQPRATLVKDIGEELDRRYQAGQISERVYKGSSPSAERATGKPEVSGMAGQPTEDAAGGHGQAAGQTGINLEAHLKPSPQAIDNIATRLKAGDDSALNEPLLNFNKDGIDLARVASMHGDDARIAVQNILNATSRGYAEGMQRAGNGVKTWAATTHDAADLGMSVESLNRVYGAYTGNGGIAAHVKASRDLLISSAQKVREVAAQLHTSGSYEDTLALQRQLGFHAMVQAQAKGIQKEVARALNVMKLSAYGEGSAFKTAQEALENLGGDAGRLSQAQLIKMAGKLKDASTLQQVNKAAQSSLRKSVNNVLLHVYRNGLLSAPNGVVLWGNALKFGLGILSRAGAVGIGAVRRGLGGTSDAITPQEFWQAHILGAKQGFADALRIPLRTLAESGEKLAGWDTKAAGELLAKDQEQFGTVWRSIAKGHNITDYAASHGNVDYVHSASPLAVNKAAMGQGGSKIMSKLAAKFGFASPDGAERWADFGDSAGRATALGINVLDKVLGVPVRLVVGNDELFRTAAARQMNTALAFRQAVSEAKASSLQGKAYTNYVQGRIATLVKNPELMGEEAAKESVDYARYQVFQERGGPITQAVQKVLSTVPELRFILPFVNTPSNIVRQTFEWTPAPLLKLAPRLLGIKTEYYKMLAAGGPKADEALARMAIGTGMLAAGYTLSAQGVITGGHPGGTSRTGGAPSYAIRIGNHWYQYNRLEPLGSLLGITADLTEILHHGVDPHTGEHDEGALSLVGAAGLAITKNVVDKSWMQSAATLLDALSNPEEGANSFLRKQLPSFVPYSGLLNKVAQEDGTAKEVFTLMDAFKARMPYFNSAMAPRRDFVGRPMRSDQPYEAGWYSPVNITPTATGKLDKELQRLATLGVAGGLKMPDKSINGIPLTADQYSRYLELSGQTIQRGGKNLEQQLDQVVGSKEYQRLTDGTQELAGSRLYVINRYVNAYRQLAQREMLKEYPQLDTEAKAKLGRKYEARTGKTPAGLEQFIQAVQQQ